MNSRCHQTRIDTVRHQGRDYGISSENESKHDINFSRMGLPREAGLLAEEIPTHRGSDQNVCHDA